MSYSGACTLCGAEVRHLVEYRQPQASEELLRSPGRQRSLFERLRATRPKRLVFYACRRCYETIDRFLFLAGTFEVDNIPSASHGAWLSPWHGEPWEEYGEHWRD